MPDNPTSNHQQLFHDLSEVEQETLVAGQGFDLIGHTDFFFQKTDIDSAADNDINLGGSESSSQSSQYKLSQITIGASFTFGLPKFNLGRSRWNNFVSSFMNNLFS